MATIFFLRIMPFILIVLRWALLLLTVLFLLAFLAQWNPDVRRTTPFNRILSVEEQISKPIDTYVRLWVPHTNKVDLTNLIKIILCIALLLYINYLHKRSILYIRYKIQKEKLKRWRAEIHVPKNNSLYIELEQKMDQFSRASNKQQSQRLYQEIADLKKRLERRSRFLAFLSMDIVDSTGMKHMEDKSLIQIDFLRFKRMVQTIFEKQNCVKSTWTPDGVMACFHSVDSAVMAAQDSLKQLKYFNEEVKQISRDFIVRCGIHAGLIYYDDKLPLEELSDQVIDIAGHMQKHAEPGTIAISKLAIKPINNAAGFVCNGKVVDDQEVYQWSI